jgi:hypothetical protein
LIFSRDSFACVNGKVSSRNLWKPKNAVESGIASSLKEMVGYCIAFERFWNISFGSVTVFKVSDATCFELNLNVLRIKIPKTITIMTPISFNIFFMRVGLLV